MMFYIKHEMVKSTGSVEEIFDLNVVTGLYPKKKANVRAGRLKSQLCFRFKIRLSIFLYYLTPVTCFL